MILGIVGAIELRACGEGATYAEDDRGGQEYSFDLFHIRLLLGDDWLRGFPALEGDSGNGEPHEKQVQDEVLPPGEPFDDAATGTGNIVEGM